MVLHQIIRFTAVTALAGGMSVCFAADDIRWTWDEPDVLEGWGTAWGPAVVVQDFFEDNTGNDGGSMHVTTDYGAGDQNVVTVMGNYAGALWNSSVQVNLAEYQTLEFDIKWDADLSTMSLADFNDPPAGGEGGLALWSTRHNGADWEWITLTYVDIPEEALDGWARVSFEIDPATPNLDQSAGVAFKKWVAAETLESGGVAAFWIDNVTLVASDVPLAPPTMSLSSDVTAGLNLITSGGGIYQRQGLRTAEDGFSWVGSGTPTTYAFTVIDFPGVEASGFQTHIFLVPNDPADSASPDWNEPDVVFFDLSGQDDGTYEATFRYKIDQPTSNSMIFNDNPDNGPVGTLGSVASSTVLGAWGITFNDDLSITVFSPENTADLEFPAEAAAHFDAPLRAYFGSQPNAAERIGLSSVLSQIRIQGAVGGDISDDFDASIDPSVWEIAAEDPNGVLVAPEDAAFWLMWSLPDAGFMLQSASGIGGASWQPFAGSTAPLVTGGQKSVLVGAADLPDAAQGYWRMAERKFTKLQILLPGEIAAPGTATGKTGTPDSQLQFTSFNITVNAVSDDWVLMADVTDTVTFSSSDPIALLPLDTPLVNGSATVEVALDTAGTHTITATNVTDPSIESATSSEVTVEEF